MGGSKTTTQQQTSSNTLDPAYKGLLMDNYATAQKNAASLTPYTGQLTAGFTPTQTQAQGVLTGIGTDPSYAANNNQAISGIKNAGTIAGADLSQYMNPYTHNVIDSTISDQDRARQIANAQENRQAGAQGAFGGSRSAVLTNLNDASYDRNTGSLIAGLNQANYGNAQSMAQSDINNRMNQAQGLISANNNGLNLATQQGGILSAVGDAQQQQQQTELSNLYNAYLQGQQLTVEQQNLLNSALGTMPVQQTVNGSGTTTEKTNNGLGGLLGSLGQIGMTAAMLA